MAAGAVEIDLCAIESAKSRSPLAQHLREATKNDSGGGIIGWVWGVKGVLISDERESSSIPSIESIQLPGLAQTPVKAEMLSSGLPGVVTAAAPINLDIESRRQSLAQLCGSNANTVEYLEHIVVMTPVLSDAIIAIEASRRPMQANPRSRQRRAAGIFQARADRARSRRPGDARTSRMLGPRADVLGHRAGRRNRARKRPASNRAQARNSRRPDRPNRRPARRRRNRLHATRPPPRRLICSAVILIVQWLRRISRIGSLRARQRSAALILKKLLNYPEAST